MHKLKLQSQGRWMPSPEQVARINKILESKTTIQKCMTGGFYEPGKVKLGKMEPEPKSLGCSYTFGSMEEGVYCDAGNKNGSFILGFVILTEDKVTVFSLPSTARNNNQAEIQAIRFAKQNLAWKGCRVFNDCQSACEKEGITWIPRYKNRLADGAARFKRNFYVEYEPTKIAALGEPRR